MPVEKFYLISHRGLAGYAPENTKTSFLYGYYLGFDHFEVDVRITKDEQFVLFHDVTLERTSNGSGLVKDYQVSQLKELDCGVWFSPAFKGEKILTLEEFLGFLLSVKAHLYLVIHIKDEMLSIAQLKRLLEVIERTQITRTHNLNIASAHEVIIKMSSCSRRNCRLLGWRPEDWLLLKALPDARRSDVSFGVRMSRILTVKASPTLTRRI